MKQPELGRKITELRITSRMTQAELAEKCNLSIRTIQRIESGLVNPRSFTTKAIFAGLDYDFRELSDSNSVEKESVVVSSKVYNIYEYIIDLFNLKTNTMKKLSILTLSFTIFGLCLFAITTKAQKDNKEEYLICNSRDIVYLFPKGQKFTLSNMKDTADIKFENIIIQEYENNIYLNGVLKGKAFDFDTVLFENNNIFIKSSYTPFISSYGKGITYLIPTGIFIDNVSAQYDSEEIRIGEYLILEKDGKIFLDGVYQDKVNSGDTVVFRDGLISIYN